MGRKPFDATPQTKAEQDAEGSAQKNPFVSRTNAPEPTAVEDSEGGKSSLDLLALGRELLAREAQRAELSGPSERSPTPRSTVSEELRASEANDISAFRERPNAEHREGLQAEYSAFLHENAPLEAPKTAPLTAVPEGPSDPSKPLHAVLFGDVASDSSAAVFGTNDALFDPAAPWPRGVVSEALAARVLGSAEPPQPLQPSIRRLQAALSSTERSALDGQTLSFDTEPLRKAVLLRWRLSAALDLKPAAQTDIDTAALDHLLSQADVVLSALQIPAGVPKDTREAFNSARAGLVKEAVRLAEVAKTAAVAIAPESRAISEQKYKNVSARLLSMSAAVKRERISLGGKGLWIALAITAAAAIVFHATAMKKQRDPIVPDVVRIGELMSAKAPNGISLVQGPVDKPVDPADLEKLKADADAVGKIVHEVMPNQFIVAPAEMPIPDMPKNVPLVKP